MLTLEGLREARARAPVVVDGPSPLSVGAKLAKFVELLVPQRLMETEICIGKQSPVDIIIPHVYAATLKAG